MARHLMDEDKLAALVNGQIDDARQYARNNLASDRDEALKYVNADEGIVEAEEGKSCVVSHDLSDTLGWIMPGLLRVFLASGQVAIYAPTKREMEDQPVLGPGGQPQLNPQTGMPVTQQVDVSAERAAQATDYLNYCFLTDCDGYRVLQSAMYDGLLLGNGIVKHWWDSAPEYKTQVFTGLNDDQFAFLAQHADVEEILEHTAYSDPGAVQPAQLGPIAAPAAPVAEPATPDGIMGLRTVRGMGEGLDPRGLTEGESLDGVTDHRPGHILAPVEPEAAVEGDEVAEEPGAASEPPQVDSAMPGVPMLHDCKIKRRMTTGRLRIAALPQEEFLIEPDAKALDETARFVAHRYEDTRSNLIKAGYDRNKVDTLGEGSARTGEGASFDEQGEMIDRAVTAPDRATEKVEVFECYVLCDYDGDGIAERRRVVVAGQGDRRSILINEEWDDDIPFSDIVPEPVPHHWRGRSLYDEVKDVQKIKTVLLRQTLDNLYQVNNPMNEVVQGAVLNMDALINRELGANIFVKQAGAIKTLPVEFTAAQSFQMLGYLDETLERRTGVSRATMALDLNALQNQTATAVNAAQSVAATKNETYARNIAELGMKRMFRCLLRLIIKHQDRPRTIRLRGKWTDMDPQGWDEGMEVSINTGLGSGSRDKDLALLTAVKTEQQLILQTLGVSNPLVPLDKYRNTLAKMVETAGLRDPDQFFGEVTPEIVAQMQQAQQQQPNPAVAKAQAEIQASQAKLQAEMQMKQAEMQAKAQFDQQRVQFEMQAKQAQAQTDAQNRAQEVQVKAQIEREKAAAELQLARDRAAAEMQALRERAAAEIELMRAKAAEELDLKRQELGFEFELKRAQMQMGMAGPSATNIQEATE